MSYETIGRSVVTWNALPMAVPCTEPSTANAGVTLLGHSKFRGGSVARTEAGAWLRKRMATWPGCNPPLPSAVYVREVPVPVEGPFVFVVDERKREDLRITRRELEILELIAQGLSNREIAEKLFVSESTVKTHSSRVFDKLGARRRTQAVQLGKEFGLLP